MHNRLISRRECAQALALVAVPRPAEYVLRSEALEFRLVVSKGKVVSRRFTNRLANETIELPVEDFTLEFDDGLTVAPSLLVVKSARKTGGGIELLLASANVEIRAQYQLLPGKTYLRKQLAVRQSSGKPRRLMRADLDNWRGVRRNWESMRADSLPYGSHPIFCENLWAGVEFVAAFNEYGQDGFVLRSRPGGKRIGAEWVELRSTVAGVAEPGRLREAFLEYIEDVRLAPPRLVACYNSWWTLPKEVKQSDYLALMQELKEKLHGKEGVFFDFVATDAGWSNRQSIWEVDKVNLPNGFRDMRAIVESAGGKPGLWMSPSEEYALNFDYDWAEKNGYVVLRNKQKGPWQWRLGVSLADPRYRAQTKVQLQKLIREDGFEHIKYDGFVAREEQPHHDLLPGDDSVEPLAEYSLELIQASKLANPRLVTEPTYLNSFANYISPWIIKYADTVWGNSGGDCPLGLGPAPDYREAHTTAREYYIFASLREVWLPQNALQYFDIVHCDRGQGFANHAAMAFGRGRFFISTYLNPKFMSEEDWHIYAGLLRWARKNQEILRNTTIVPSRVELGEAYLYAHWLGQRGIVAVRNPSNESKDFVIDLGKAGAPKQLSDAICYTQYPYRKGIASGITGTTRLPLKLAPWELLFLEIMPRSELHQPVAIGARWYRDSRGSMSIAPERNTEKVRLIDPASGERSITFDARSREELRAELQLETLKRLPAAMEFELECSVSVSRGAGKGAVLLLLEFPGRKHYPSHCSARVNGAPVTLRESSSAGHIGYYMPTPNSPWKDVMPYESEWTWYIAEVGPGASTIRFTGGSAQAQSRIGLWAWADWDVTAKAVSVSTACPEPEMPQYRAQWERQGICLRPPR